MNEIEGYLRLNRTRPGGVHCRSFQIPNDIIQRLKGKSIKRKTEAEKELA
ncbi:hypothetical protein [Methanosarcina horonobensis]|nr:hypothetical protein [Methanosarcina horonobensis]